MSLQFAYEQGLIKLMYNKGLISGTTFLYFEYNTRYFQLRDEGHNYSEALALTAMEFGVSVSTIKRAVVKVN